MDFQSTSAQLVKDLMRDFGLTEFQAAGLVGNLAYESGNFKQLQEKEPLIPGSKGGSVIVKPSIKITKNTKQESTD